MTSLATTTPKSNLVKPTPGMGCRSRRKGKPFERVLCQGRFVPTNATCADGIPGLAVGVDGVRRLIVVYSVIMTRRLMARNDGLSPSLTLPPGGLGGESARYCDERASERSNPARIMLCGAT